jgi:hypothetical protein
MTTEAVRFEVRLHLWVQAVRGREIRCTHGSQDHQGQKDGAVNAEEGQERFHGVNAAYLLAMNKGRNRSFRRLSWEGLAPLHSTTIPTYPKGIAGREYQYCTGVTVSAFPDRRKSCAMIT